MTTTKRTDKDHLIKGLKLMGGSLACMFIGPILYYTAGVNKEKPLYIPLVIVACLILGLAIFLAYKGINTILDSMFKKNTN